MFASSAPLPSTSAEKGKRVVRNRSIDPFQSLLNAQASILQSFKSLSDEFKVVSTSLESFEDSFIRTHFQSCSKLFTRYSSALGICCERLHPLSQYSDSEADLMAWVSLVFGAIQECSEKGVIIGDCGKRIVRDTDSLVSRQSSFGRIDPTSQTTPTALVADADLWLGIVPFSSQPSDTRFSVPGGGRRHRPHKHTEKAPSPSVFKKTSQSNNAPVPMDSGPTNPSSHTTHDIPNLDSRGSRLLQVEIPVSPDSSHGHSSTNSSIRPGGGRVHYIPAPIRKAISDHTWFALGRARLPRDPTPGDCQPLLDASISGGLLEEHGGSMSTRFSDPSTSPIHLPTNPNDLSGSAGSVTPSQESSHFDPSRPPTPILAQTPGAVESLRRSSYQSTEIDEKGSEIEEYSFIVTPAPPFLPDIPSGEFEVSWPPNASTPAMLPALPPSHPSSRSSRVTFLDLQS